MAYERINWQNEPSEATALNDVNLNKMDSAIYELDGKATATDTAITALQDGKVDKVNGKGLSQVDNISVTSRTNNGDNIALVQINKVSGTEGIYIKNGIVVDSALSSSSTNPVQNKVVKGALDDKVDKESGKGLSEVKSLTVTKLTDVGTDVAQVYYLDQSDRPHATYIKNGITVDSALSSSSKNPVQNKVVKSAIDEKSTVAISDTLETGTTLANITIDGTTTAIKGSDIDVDEELSPTSTNPVENKAIYDALNNLLPSKTVSGNPISISDASGFNAKALTVSMSPIQDLHGYSYPWAGGAGKNKLDNSTASSLANVTYKNGVVTEIEADSRNSALFVLQAYNNGMFVRNLSTVYGSVKQLPFTKDSTFNQINFGNSGERKDAKLMFNVSNLSDGEYIWCFTSENYTKHPFSWKDMMIVESSVTDYSYEPYSNICPISGRTEASVTRTGKNQCYQVLNGLLSTTAQSAIYYSNNDCRSLVFNCKKGVTYTASGVTANRCIWGVFDSIPNSGTNASDFANLGNNLVAFTPTIDGVCILYVSNTPIDTTNAQIELGSTASAYEPYTAETHTHEYSETIYGGTDDFVNGGASSNYGKIVFDGTEGWVSSVGRYQLRLNGVMKSGSYYDDDNVLCSAYPKSATLDVNNTVVVGYNSDYLYFYVTEDFPTLNDWKTRLQQGDIELTYLKATPTTISTSAKEITLLKGNNVLSTNADDMELKYSVSLDSLLT